MRTNQGSELDRSQRSVLYYPIMTKEGRKVQRDPDYFSYTYPGMLIEDIEAGIMPIGGHSQKTSFRVFISPPDSTIERLIAESLSKRDYYRNLAETTCDFFLSCAQIVMGYEEALYEIVYLSKPKDKTIVGFELVSVPPLTVLRRQGRLVQYVPLEIAEERRVSQYQELPIERILSFKLPPIVQGKLASIMEPLVFISTHMFPDFAFKAVTGESESTPFEYDIHKRAHDIAIAEAGKLVGWNARGSFEKAALEYYSLYRELRFQRFKAELRDSILSTLNDGLKRIGDKIGFSAQLQIEGLPTTKDVEDAQAHLSAGDLPFGEILKPFLYY